VTNTRRAGRDYNEFHNFNGIAQMNWKVNKVYQGVQPPDKRKK
jgi:hypothetical protein